MMIEMALWSAVSPLALALLASLWSYPALLEELVKWVILRREGRNLTAGLIVGLIFGFSESILYMTNVWSGGQWQAAGLRLLLTVPMHGLTGMLIGTGMKKNVTWIGVLAAMLLHTLFNYFVGLSA